MSSKSGSPSVVAALRAAFYRPHEDCLPSASLVRCLRGEFKLANRLAARR